VGSHKCGKQGRGIPHVLASKASTSKRGKVKMGQGRLSWLKGQAKGSKSLAIPPHDQGREKVTSSAGGEWRITKRRKGGDITLIIRKREEHKKTRITHRFTNAVGRKMKNFSRHMDQVGEGR